MGDNYVEKGGVGWGMWLNFLNYTLVGWGGWGGWGGWDREVGGGWDRWIIFWVGRIYAGLHLLIKNFDTTTGWN